MRNKKKFVNPYYIKDKFKQSTQKMRDAIMYIENRKHHVFKGNIMSYKDCHEYLKKYIRNIKPIDKSDFLRCFSSYNK